MEEIFRLPCGRRTYSIRDLKGLWFRDFLCRPMFFSSLLMIFNGVSPFFLHFGAAFHSF